MTFRPLFVNEGALGAGVVGHPRVEDSIRSFVERQPDIDGRFRRLPPMTRLDRLAVRGLPRVGSLDIDAQRTRWHLVQSRRARAVVRAALAEGQPDALHVNSHSIGLSLGDVMAEVPTFLSVDSTIRQWEHLGVWRPVRPWTDALLAPSYARERRAFAAAAGVISWTRWAGDCVREECPEATVYKVHPGIDVDVFQPASREARDRLRVLFVGGRFNEKGGLLLLEALQPRLGVDVELDVVTTSPLEARTGVRVHRLGAGSPELVRLFQQADVFCLPTFADAAPFAVAESMACGTPVVSTTVGAIPELLGHGRGGISIPPRNGRALREALDSLLDDPSRRAAMGAYGRSHSVLEMDTAKQASRLLDIMRRR